jgi:ankyrin repeat protein
MSEFMTLPFGDYWCVVFAPEGRVRGICSISISKAVADEVVRGIDLASPAVRVTKVDPDAPASLFPCVTFELAGSPFDWFGSDSKAEHRRIPDKDNYFPTLDARAVPGAPMSLGDLQDLFWAQTNSVPTFAEARPLCVAAIEGKLEEARVLLKNNPNLALFKTDSDMTTPLHLAASKGHKDLVELLLANKADVNARNVDGHAAVHLAMYCNKWDVVELLIDNRADVSLRNPKEGVTPLHLAAGDGRKRVVEWLLANNAEVNAKALDGETPLMSAARRGHQDVVELLRAHGGTVNQEVLTVIEADGLYGELPTGLAGWEEPNLSECFIHYALEQGGKDLSFDSIRSQAKKKYSTAAEQTNIVLQALDILLQQFNLEKIAGGRRIVTKVKEALSAGR